MSEVYYYIATGYYALMAPVFLAIIGLSIYYIIKKIIQKNINFGLVVYSWIIVYAIVEMAFIPCQMANSAIQRVDVVLRSIVVMLNNLGVELLVTLLDLVILSWAKINSVVDPTNSTTFRNLVIIIIIKSIFVYSVTIAYFVIILGGWSRVLTYGFTLGFGAVNIINILIFLALFYVVMLKMRAMITSSGESTNTVTLAYRKLMTTFVFVFVTIALEALSQAGAYAILGYQVFSGDVALWTHIVTDMMVVLIEIVPWPGIFWIMIVTYSQDSAVNKLLSGTIDKKKSESSSQDVKNAA